MRLGANYIMATELCCCSMKLQVGTEFTHYFFFELCCRLKGDHCRHCFLTNNLHLHLLVSFCSLKDKNEGIDFHVKKDSIEDQCVQSQI